MAATRLIATYIALNRRDKWAIEIKRMAAIREMKRSSNIRFYEVPAPVLRESSCTPGARNPFLFLKKIYLCIKVSIVMSVCHQVI